MNNIYVDELPIKVAQRVIYFEDGKLNCVELMFDSSYEPEEIKLITDRLAEERKKVVQEIREKLKDMDFLAHETELGERLDCFSKYKVLDILLRVERGE